MTAVSHHASGLPELSVVVPVYNESDNVLDLAQEISLALQGQISFEMIFVDDASRDDTRAVLQAAKKQFPELRVLHHVVQSGQSTAVYHGVKAARALWIATLDGDGQNDPSDIPKLWGAKREADPQFKCFAGWRVNRRDDIVKRFSSKIANAVRSRILRDATPDTGCGIKLFERKAFLDLPYFDHMHRFLPALFQRMGWRVQSVPVNHRPRTRGVSKYGMWQRLWVGLIDLQGVGWLLRRARLTQVQELD
jgi:dolichol-phosphate mannosyltransferase